NRVKHRVRSENVQGADCEVRKRPEFFLPRNYCQRAIAPRNLPFASSHWESRDEEVRAKEQPKQRVARPQSEEAIMKCRILQFAPDLALFAALSTSFPFAAQTPAGPSHYVVIDLGTLGGTDAGGSSSNNRGWVSGMSIMAGNQTTHAALWINGAKI